MRLTLGELSYIKAKHGTINLPTYTLTQAIKEYRCHKILKHEKKL